ncbi:YopJ family acetyltransferase [Legionella spiritensis]|uniref:Dot/Icm T4SS effector n=1 Tax=Legionella spiritensis TaxID=452 RepID=A0A0W0YW90_LEGSP|nr:hypothetical protein [Legionella spiritensis]KTD61162.1 hypothetical protein Lspi_2782 [Legionella spiritensis]SNV45303.1 Uncharacterised protein [Legionella spiritensis]
MQQRLFDKLSTASAEAFRNDLFDVLDKYIDDHEDDDIADFDFLQTIHIDLAKDKLSLAEIFEKIELHITTKGYDQVNECFQELSDVKSNPKYQTVFSDDHKKNSQPVIHEPTKIKLRGQIGNFDDPKVYRDDMVRLMMHDFSQKIPYNGRLIDADPFTMLPLNEEELQMDSEEQRRIAHSRRENALLFAEIDRVIAEDTSGHNRIQILVRSGPHYTTLDIDKKNRSCFIVDAVDDSSQYRLHQIPDFSKLVDKVFYVKSPMIPSGKSDETMKGALQKDSSSCSVFALDHSFQVALNPEVHQWLESNAVPGSEQSTTLYHVTWNQLPPDMVKNAQSTTVIRHYMDSNPNVATQVMALTGDNKSGHGLVDTKETFKSVIHGYCDQYSEGALLEMMKVTTSVPETSMKHSSDDVGTKGNTTQTFKEKLKDVVVDEKKAPDNLPFNLGN